MSVVSKEQATKEVNEWLDRMDIPVDNREKEAVKEFINAIIEFVEKGFLVFNSDETITQILRHPLAGGETKEIVYDFRYEIGEYNKATKGVSAVDAVDYAVARLSLISAAKYPKDVFLKMKRADYNVASKLTVFF